MDNEKAYVEVEHEYIGDWPGPPPEQSHRQYYTLAEKLKKDIRSRSITDGIDPQIYGNLIFEAKNLFDDLRRCINYSERMTEKQLEKFHSQMFWYHKESHESGLENHKQEIWPIKRYNLIDCTHKYLETPVMWSDTLDYLITDALIYAETAATRQFLLESNLLSSFMGSAGAFSIKLFGEIGKWSLIFGSLWIAHELSSELFLALSISVIAFQLNKSINGTPQSKVAKLYAEMVNVYTTCNIQNYNPAVIWDMCRTARKQCATYDAVLYDLLEKQCVQNAKKWRSSEMAYSSDSATYIQKID